MLPTPRKFYAFPSVVPADCESEITILASERIAMFRDGAEYTLLVRPVNGDVSYRFPTQTTYTLVARDGALRFSHHFEGEQEHVMILMEGEKEKQRMAIYSLREDLYGKRPLKGDLHSHSYRSDGTRDPAAQFGYYREQGYDFVALTDHNRAYPGEEIDVAFDGVDTGLCRVFGEEVHAPISPVHIVHVGGKDSVALQYVLNREKYEKDWRCYLDKVPSHVPARYAERYAQAQWSVDEIHRVGGIAIFPHPYWRPAASDCYNVCDELSMLLLESGMFDAYEVIGGMSVVGCNMSVALWGEVRAKGVTIPVVGSSDAHNVENDQHFPHKFTICFAESHTNDSICEAIRKGLCVAVEASGNGYDRQYRCYGSLRLVEYAQFLLQYYFPKAQNLAEGVGTAMRLYAMEQADASLIEAGQAQCARFADRFFGRLAPALPSKSLLELEEHFRETHLAKGPKTRGSNVDSTPAKKLI